MSFITINNLKNKDKIIHEYLSNRNKIKNDFSNEKIFNKELTTETEKFFKPLTDPLLKNKNKELSIIENSQSKILNEIKTLKQPRVIPFTPQKQIQDHKSQSQLQLPAPLIPEKVNSNTNTNTIVSHLIASYLKDKTRTENGYSITYRKEKDRYSIGNQYIFFNDNQMTIKSKMYEATEGLMELMTKPTPNESKITEEDYSNYKQILSDTHAMYRGFDTTSNLIPHNNSSKYRIIKEKLFPNLFQPKNLSGTGFKTEFLPSNPNELVNQLRLSVSSYKAGNNGEFNRINSILDTLTNLKHLSVNDYKIIYKNLFKI